MVIKPIIIPIYYCQLKTLLVIHDKEITITDYTTNNSSFHTFLGVKTRAWKRRSHVYGFESMKLHLEALGRDLLQGLLLENKTSHVVTLGGRAKLKKYLFSTSIASLAK